MPYSEAIDNGNSPCWIVCNTGGGVGVGVAVVVVAGGDGKGVALAFARSEDTCVAGDSRAEVTRGRGVC